MAIAEVSPVDAAVIIDDKQRPYINLRKCIGCVLARMLARWRKRQ